MMDFVELAKVCAPDVHITTLAAVVRHESKFDPLVIHVNGKPGRQIRPKTRDEAISEVRTLLAKGASFDAGYGQINNANWERLGITPENVFDPCTNLRAAQAVLVECYQGANRKLDGSSALFAALSCYNTGNYKSGLSNGYVKSVVAGAGAKVPGIPAGEVLSAPTTIKTAPLKSQTRASPRVSNNAARRSDVFATPRPDAFTQSFSAFAPVGSIIYHGRAQ